MRDARHHTEYLSEPADKAHSVRRMFGAIAPRYDLLNHVLTLNIDRRWRRRSVDMLLEGADPAGLYLDACAGTLDLAVEVARRPRFTGTVIASDFALPMLERGGAKAEGLPIERACADALRLPHPSNVFDGAIVGFGVRNFADVEAGLIELDRVVRPGGKVVVLELSTPSRQPLRALYLLYFTRVLPSIGRLISGHDSAYGYLPASVRDFPSPEELAGIMEKSGLRDVRFRRLLAGIAAIHVGTAGPGGPDPRVDRGAGSVRTSV